jgi:hypothetical protein
MSDPIVDEVRRMRDEHAAHFNYDLDAIFAELQEEERASGLKFVSFSPRRIESNGVLEFRTRDNTRPEGTLLTASEAEASP